MDKLIYTYRLATRRNSAVRVISRNTEGKPRDLDAEEEIWRVVHNDLLMPREMIEEIKSILVWHNESCARRLSEALEGEYTPR